MFLFEILDISLAAVVLLGLATQVIVPLFRKRKLFPLFRPKGEIERLEEELERVKHDQKIDMLKQELADVHEQNLQRMRERLDKMSQTANEVLGDTIPPQESTYEKKGKKQQQTN